MQQNLKYYTKTLKFQFKLVNLHRVAFKKNLPNVTFIANTKIKPVDGLLNIKDKIQMIGIIPKLYASNIENIMAKSLAPLQCWEGLSDIMTMIIIEVIRLVKRSHRTDTAQKTGKFAPLAYCRNLALFSFSYAVQMEF